MSVPGERGCCQVLNFVAPGQDAGRYLGEHPAVVGLPISIPEAIADGEAIFGDVLEPR